MSTQGTKKEKPDYKFIFGLVILIAAFAVMGGGFWKMVAEQAELVKEEERRLEEEAITAIYVEAGEFLKQGYFVDMNAKTVFTGTIPKEGIYNREGTLIPGDVLENGDMVKIYGDGKITRSLPGEYPNITKMQRNGRASLEELQPFLELAEEALGQGAES